MLFDADGRPYIKGLRELDTQTDRAGRQMESTWGKYGKKAGQAAAAGLAIIAASAAGIGVATVKAAATFEYEMSRIKANANATSGELAALKETVIQLGKDTVFSAGETAQAANELVKAGLSVGQTMQALPGMLALASAGELNVAQAAELAANALTMFGLSADQTEQVADALALAANRSTTEVDLLGMSLQMAGTVSAQAGLTLQETSAALALLANNGIKGSDAGTSLKQMFMQLMGPSEKARDIMEQYGIAAYDANGEMLAMDKLLENVSRGLAGTTDEERDFALATIFGSDAVRAANILLKEGADSYRKMTAEVSRSGAAQDIAKQKMDNLKGSWEQLKGSVETLAIGIGEKALPVIRDFVDELTDIVNEAIETGDWSKVGQELGELIGDGIQLATPYIIDAMVIAAKAGAKAIPLAIVAGITQAPTGSEFDKMRDFLAERMAGAYRDLPKAVAFQKALEDLQSFWTTSLLGERSMFVPTAKSKEEILALAEALGLTLTGDSWQVVAETNQQMWDRMVGGKGWSGGAWKPGDDLSEGLGFITDAASDATEAMGDVAGAIEDAQAASDAYTKTLSDLYSSEVSPASIWEDAEGSLKSYLTELDKQIAAWGSFETNLKTLATQFGPDLGADVIMEAAKLGPDFVAALVGSDPETTRKALEGLKTTMGHTMDSLGTEIAALSKPVGEQSGEVYVQNWAAAFADYDLPGYIRENIGKTDLKDEGKKDGDSYVAGIREAFGVGVTLNLGINPAGGLEAGLGLLTGKVSGLSGSTGNVWTTLKSMYPGAVWMGGYATSGHVTNSDHYTGHAFDVGGSAGYMQMMANALARNFESWGIKQIIYNRMQNRGSGWYPYGGPNPHIDHIHVGTYDMGGWVLPPAQRSVGRGVPIIAHEGEYVLTQNQAQAMFSGAQSYAEGGWVMPEGSYGSYISRESARYSMYEALYDSGDASLEQLEQTLMDKIRFIGLAVAEAEAQLKDAKAKGAPQGDINELSERLSELQSDAARAAQELEDLADIPLEDALDDWNDRLGQLDTLMGILGESSTADLSSYLTEQLGIYKEMADTLLELGDTSGAIDSLESMFSIQRSTIDRELDAQLESIDGQREAWEQSWQARYDAIDNASLVSALEAQLSTLREKNSAALEELRKSYDDRLAAMQEGDQAITREEQRQAARENLTSLEAQLQSLMNQSTKTASDLDRIQSLRSQIAAAKKDSAKQEAAWEREDARSALERQRDAEIEALESQQEAEEKSLQSRIDTAQKMADVQRKALEAERKAQEQFWEQQEEAARDAAQARVDIIVDQYAREITAIMAGETAISEILGTEAPSFNPSGAAADIAAAAQGIKPPGADASQAEKDRWAAATANLNATLSGYSKSLSDTGETLYWDGSRYLTYDQIADQAYRSWGLGATVADYDAYYAEMYASGRSAPGYQAPIVGADSTVTVTVKVEGDGTTLSDDQVDKLADRLQDAVIAEVGRRQYNARYMS